jgi:N-acetylneuraminate synthase
VEFFSSPFSVEAVDLLLEVGVRIWKVASGEVGNSQLLTALKASGLPVILSSGLSTIAELRSAIDLLSLSGSRVAVLQCATQYPTAPERVGLNVISRLRSEFECVVGISDHSSTIYPSLAAAALGGRVFESHIKEPNDGSGPDASSSLTEEQLRQLVDGVRFIRNSVLNPVDKDVLLSDQIELRKIFGRSIVAARELPAGHEITEDDLAYKKPGGGLDYSWYVRLVGAVLTRSLEADEALELGDVKEH